MAGSITLGPVDTYPTFAQVSRDAKRTADHKNKWRLGAVHNEVDAFDMHPRPYHGVSQNSMRLDKLNNRGKKSTNVNIANKAAVCRNPHSRGLNVNDDYVNNRDGDWSACADRVLDAGARDYGRGNPDGEPNDGFFYSFDRPTGPSDGSDVLTQALGHAVERFEDQKTKKLIRDEYDVVIDADSEDETFVRGHLVEEDFEMVGSF